MSLLPKDLEDMLGTQEEFEASRKSKNVEDKIFKLNELDEDGDDLVREKIEQEYQENMRDDMKEMLEENGLDEFDI